MYIAALVLAMLLPTSYACLKVTLLERPVCTARCFIDTTGFQINLVTSAARHEHHLSSTLNADLQERPQPVQI